jgi:hypothetical protein
LPSLLIKKPGITYYCLKWLVATVKKNCHTAGERDAFCDIHSTTGGNVDIDGRIMRLQQTFFRFWWELALKNSIIAQPPQAILL